MSAKNAYWKGKTHTEEYKKAMSEKLKGRKTPWLNGKPLSEATRKKLSLIHKGRIHSPETRRKLSEAHKKRVSLGIHHAWKGGITPINKAIRASQEMRIWRVAVFIRDNRTCIWCGSKKQIEADHIKPFAFFPELRFAIDNGRTLCKPCHQTTDTYGSKIRFTK